MSIRDISLISILSIILVVQEQLLNLLPNIQLTVLFIVVFSRFLGFKKSLLLIIIYVLLDNLLYPGLPLVYWPFMVIGWCFIPFVFNRVYCGDNKLVLAFWSVACSLVYCWIFIIPSCLIMNMSFVDYLWYDIPFELAIGVSSFVSVLLLYEPCMRVLERISKR